MTRSHRDRVAGLGAAGEAVGAKLVIVRVHTYDDAVARISTNGCGNGTAIFTDDGGAARRFEQEVEVGMIGINVPIPDPVACYFSALGKVVISRGTSPAARRQGGLELGSPRNG